MRRCTLYLCFLTSIVLGQVETSTAQNHRILEPALLECRYLEQKMVDTITHRRVPDTLILHVGSKYSAFFSKDRVFVDSLWSKRGGFNEWVALMRQYLKEGHHEDLTSNDVKYYYFNYPNPGLVTTRTEINRNGVEFTEEREAICWEFRDSVKTVLGFECHQAEANFRGRHWIAWYTLEVAVSQGPWKLWGLPGLICEAYDSKDYFHYSLVSLTPTPDIDIRLYNWHKSYQKTTRTQFYKARAKNLELMMEDARQSGLGGMASTSSNGPGDKELDWK